MAKKLSQPKRPRRGLFDEFERVKNVRQGESLRFRDAKGRLVKFDARKKLIAEVWLGNKRTNRVLNATSKGQPLPQKFDSRSMRKRVTFLEAYKKGPRLRSEPKQAKIKIDSRFSIADNIEAKLDNMLTDIVTWSRRGTGAFVGIEIFLNRDGERIFEAVSVVIKSASKSTAALELARYIIYRLYRNDMRASNLKISPMGKRGKYVRGFEVAFTWDETKSLKDM